MNILNKKKRTFLSALTMTSLLAAVPVIAANSTVTDSGTYKTNVTCDSESSFNVTLPSNIVLNNDGTKDYTITVNGNIPDYDTITVSPDASFTMTQAGKADVNATVSQAIKSFNWADAVNGKTVTGTIEAGAMSAGDWQGSFNFHVSLSANTAPDVTIDLSENVVESIKGKNVYLIGDRYLADNNTNRLGPDYYLNTYFGANGKNYAVTEVTTYDRISTPSLKTQTDILVSKIKESNNTLSHECSNSERYLNENSIIVVSIGYDDFCNKALSIDDTIDLNLMSAAIIENIGLLDSLRCPEHKEDIPIFFIAQEGTSENVKEFAIETLFPSLYPGYTPELYEQMYEASDQACKAYNQFMHQIIENCGYSNVHIIDTFYNSSDVDNFASFSLGLSETGGITVVKEIAKAYAEFIANKN